MSASKPLLSAVALFVVGCGLPSSGQPGKYTYHHDVRPIIEARCGECHGPVGGILPQFDEHTVPLFADQMLAAVDSGLMPPWVPGPAGVELVGKRELPADERAILLAWSNGGRALGDPADFLPRPRAGGFVPDRPPDLVLRMPTAYRGDPERLDDNRCFVLPAWAGFISAYQWESDPESPKHHMAAGVVDAASLALARTIDPAGAGYDCSTDWRVPIGGLLGAVGMGPAGGQTYPAGSAVIVPAGLVLQVHYLPNQAKGPSRDGIKIWIASAGSKPIQSISIYAPAELPCPDSTSGACSRDVALAAPADRAYNENVLRDCGYASYDAYRARATQPDNLPGQFIVSSSCTKPIPAADGQLAGMHIHAHARMISAKLSAQQPDGSWLVLLDLPRWRWVWESSYQPVVPVKLRAGQSLKLECTGDNGPANQPGKSGPGHDRPADPPLLPPRHVKGGPERDDEMCVFFGDWL